MSRAVSSDGIASAELAMSVGLAVRNARLRAGLTLVELGGRSGVTQAFLSQLENGRSMPSLLTLHRIAEALGVSAQTLLPGEEPELVSLVRVGEGRQYDRAEVPGAMMERFLVSGRRQMEPCEVRAVAGSASGEFVEHNGEEMLYMLSGRLKVELDNLRVEVLGAGDCLYYPATVPHRWEVVGATDASFLVIATPPSF
jgi:transcriptional regulator with XRE-family HTH domain